MKKRDLKTGMLVVNTSGERAIVMRDTSDGDVLVGDGDVKGRFWEPFCEFEEKDILEVYGFSNNFLGVSFSISKRDLIYDATRVKEYTIEQLQEKLGEEFKIIK